MVKVNKNIKTKLIKIISQKRKRISKGKSKDVFFDESKNESKQHLLHKTITPKKTTSKREKYRQKHKNLMKKFIHIKKHEKEERARKNREKTAVIGDLKPLKDALPSLDDIFKLAKENQLKTGLNELHAKAKVKHLSAKQKIKRKKEIFMQKMKDFQSVLKNTEFKKNPREAVRFHIKYNHGLIEE